MSHDPDPWSDDEFDMILQFDLDRLDDNPDRYGDVDRAAAARIEAVGEIWDHARGVPTEWIAQLVLSGEATSSAEILGRLLILINMPGDDPDAAILHRRIARVIADVLRGES